MDMKLENGSKVSTIGNDKPIRGHRAKMKLYENEWMIQEDLINDVFGPFTVDRSDMEEMNGELYISSAGVKGHLGLEE